MSKLTKNQKAAYAKVEPHKAYKLAEAASLLKEITFTKFDASVDIDVRLGVDPRKANQLVLTEPARRFAFWCSVLPRRRRRPRPQAPTM